MKLVEISNSIVSNPVSTVAQAIEMEANLTVAEAILAQYRRDLRKSKSVIYSLKTQRTV